MGKDNRPWRKLVKKLRRKRIRQAVAQDRDAKEISDLLTQADVKEQLCQQEMQKLRDEEECIQHELEEQKWIENELQDQLKYRMEKAKQDKLDAIKAAEEKKIREEWNERVEREKKIQEEKERVEKELKEKQDIETPPLPYVMPEAVDNGKETCSFFQKTGVCLFGDQCSRNHLRPTLSSVILIPNFFSNFSLEQSQHDEYDTDLFLECDDSDLHKEFLEFYDDIMPEFRKFGKIIQFKVCRNFGAHLRGNVYIQYENIRQSVDAYRAFNGRFYNGKQLSLQFSKIDSWKSAICGLFLRKRCLKGKACNFLHVFRNPTTEFVSADQDWKKPDPVHLKSVQNDSKSPRETGKSKTDSFRSRHSKSSFLSESANKDYRRSRSKSPRHTSVSKSYRKREHNFRNRDKHRSADKNRHRHSRRSSSRSRSPKSKKIKRVQSPDKTNDDTKESPACTDDNGQKKSSTTIENTSTKRKSKIRKKSKKKKVKKEKKHRKHKKESKLSKEIDKDTN